MTRATGALNCTNRRRCSTVPIIESSMDSRCSRAEVYAPMKDRREALKIIGAGAAAFPILGQEKYAAKVFDGPQLLLLAELTDRIIPRTETPGASDAGV